MTEPLTKKINKTRISDILKNTGMTGIDEPMTLVAHFTDGSSNFKTLSSNNTAPGDDEFVYWNSTDIRWSSNVNQSTATKAFATVEYTKT